MMAMLIAALLFGFAATCESKYAVFGCVSIGVWNAFVALQYILRKSK